MAREPRKCPACQGPLPPYWQLCVACKDRRSEKLRENAPLCACGCGDQVAWRRELRRYNRFIANHRSPEANQDRLKKAERRECPICREDYLPTGLNQTRCENCRGVPLEALETGPACLCGCGQHVNWSRADRVWRTFVAGHSSRVLRCGGGKPVPEHLQKWREYNCEGCGKACRTKRLRRFCGRKCPKRWNIGEGHPKWKGGITGDGYRKTPGTNRREHRLVMEKVVGRPLLLEEVVHHKDENRLNNDPENLFLFDCQSCHHFAHGADRPLVYRYAEIHHLREMISIAERRLKRQLTAQEVVYHSQRDLPLSRRDAVHVFHCDYCRRRYDRGGVPLRYRYAAIHKTDDAGPTNNNQRRRLRRLLAAETASSP